jgi:hypothetical protein
MATPVLDDGDGGTIVEAAGIAMARNPMALTPGTGLRRSQLPNEVLPKIRRSPHVIQNRFIALLKPPFKSSDDYQHVGWGKKPAKMRLRIGRNRDKQGSV